MSSIYQQNYRKLANVFGKNWYEINHVVLENEPFMKLHFENLGKNHFAMAHYYEQNGDLVADPDMEIKLYPDLKMVEALTFQNSLSFQRVYPDPENINLVNLRAKISMNKFLAFWLKNIINQGFKRTA